MKILHIITGLNNGGAEAVLFRLIAATQHEVTHSVVSMQHHGVYGERLCELGVHVDTLNLTRNILSLLRVSSLARIIKAQSPDIVQTWMYHADLFGGIVARASGCHRIVWGIRHSSLHEDKITTRMTARLCGMLSGYIPNFIACCSFNAALIHQGMGYRAGKFRIIPNGYELSCFCPNDAARKELRSAWCIEQNESLLGMVGRWNPQKDHANLFKALTILAESGLAFRCILVGPGMCIDNSELDALIRQYGLEDRVILTGPRSDVPDVMNALDVHILASCHGEAFPNVVAESMACGTPCVATDVGDAALIVGNDEWVVPPRNPRMLAEAIGGVMDAIRREGRDTVGAKCHQRIVDCFSLGRMIASYRALWDEVMNGGDTIS